MQHYLFNATSRL